MICINVVYCIPLLKPYIDVYLDVIETRVYDQVFKKNIDRRTFKRILEKAKLSFVPEGGSLVTQGQAYDGVYLVAKLKKTHNLVFKENGAEIFKEAKPYTWSGIIEFDQNRKAQTKKEEYKWPISISLEKKVNSEELKDEDPLSAKYEEPLYIYFFKFEEINKLYGEENGIHVRNALHSVWLEAMTHKIIEIDMKVGRIQKEKQENFTGNINKTDEKGFDEKVKDVVCEDDNGDKNESQHQLNGDNNDQEKFVDNYETNEKLMETEYDKEERVKYNATNENENKDNEIIPEINQVDKKEESRLKVEDVNLEEKNSINRVKTGNQDSLEHEVKKDSIVQVEEEYDYESEDHNQHSAYM